ncbi:hypothetical protein HMPREF9554_03102 [Treponema phagedenis F0421]|nr:hypothetical protein HMPREF9554_03102 [Treponema phagedenis F0421]
MAAVFFTSFRARKKIRICILKNISPCSFNYRKPVVSLHTVAQFQTMF